MNSIRQIQELNKRELEAGVTPEGSWHADYRDTAYIYIGGLPYELSEGDIITIFSQYGEPVYIKLVRDKETGKSKGFAFLKYEDQRSTDLAVDNLGGADVMGRILRVDHTRYKRHDDEEPGDNTMGDVVMEDAKDTESEEEVVKRPLLKEERELAELMRDHDEDDPMKAYLIEQKKEEVQEALKKLPKIKTKKDKKDRKHHHHRSHRHHSQSRSPDRRKRSERDRSREKHSEKRRDKDRDTEKSSRRHRLRTPERRRRDRSPSTGDDLEQKRRRRRDSDSPRRPRSPPRRERSPHR